MPSEPLHKQAVHNFVCNLHSLFWAFICIWLHNDAECHWGGLNPVSMHVAIDSLGPLSLFPAWRKPSTMITMICTLTGTWSTLASTSMNRSLVTNTRTSDLKMGQNVKVWTDVWSLCLLACVGRQYSCIESHRLSCVPMGLCSSQQK